MTWKFGLKKLNQILRLDIYYLKTQSNFKTWHYFLLNYFKWDEIYHLETQSNGMTWSFFVSKLYENECYTFKLRIMEGQKKLIEILRFESTKHATFFE